MIFAKALHLVSQSGARSRETNPCFEDYGGDIFYVWLDIVNKGECVLLPLLQQDILVLQLSANGLENGVAPLLWASPACDRAIC